GRRISSLLGGRTLGGPALRKDVLRQFGTAEELRARIPGHRKWVLRRGGARHHSLDGRVAQRSRARRILRFGGRGLFHGRRWRLFHLDGGGSQGGSRSGRS